MNDETVHQLCKQAVAQVMFTCLMFTFSSIAGYPLFFSDFLNKLVTSSMASKCTFAFGKVHLFTNLF